MFLQKREKIWKEVNNFPSKFISQIMGYEEDIAFVKERMELLTMGILLFFFFMMLFMFIVAVYIACSRNGHNNDNQVVQIREQRTEDVKPLLP